MPLTKSAIKALKVSHRKNLVNTRLKSKYKLAVKQHLATPTNTSLSQAFSTIDRAVKKNLLHRNNAANLKSRLAKLKLTTVTTKTTSTPKAKPRRSASAK